MKSCPVCNAADLTTTQCAKCGFDLSTDYESYPTVMQICGKPLTISARNADWKKSAQKISPVVQMQEKPKENKIRTKHHTHFSQDAARRWFPDEKMIGSTVTISSRYEVIDSYAFRQVLTQKKHIKTLIIPDTVLEISKNAFDGLVIDESIVIPASVRVIGENAFTLSKQGYVDCATDGEAFMYCTKKGLRSSPVMDSNPETNDGLGTPLVDSNPEANNGFGTPLVDSSLKTSVWPILLAFACWLGALVFGIYSRFAQTGMTELACYLILNGAATIGGLLIIGKDWKGGVFANLVMLGIINATLSVTVALVGLIGRLVGLLF